MSIIQGGVVIHEGIPRSLNPFGRWRLVPLGASIQNVVNASEANDTIYIAPGAYDEAVVVPVTKPNISLIGVGGRGSVFLNPAAVNAVALTVKASDVSLVNVGGEGNGSGGGLLVSDTSDLRRFRAYGCKFEGGAFAAKVRSDGAANSIGDVLLEGCELCWTETALLLQSINGSDPVTQLRIINNLLHNFSSRGVHVDTVQVADLWMEHNTFARQEDGSEPTNEYVLANVGGTTGRLAGNHFPAAKATGKIVVDALVVKSGNFYTDGVEGQA
jgi:hypothetical protein